MNAGPSSAPIATGRRFCSSSGQATRRFGWSVTAWVLMTNHFHLVLKTPDPNLSKGMQWLNSAYANSFNRIHRRGGHLFQGRFKAFLIDEESYFADVLRYVVLNPVRATMCARPEEYRWSSYRATAALEAAPDWPDVRAVHRLFGPDVRQAGRRCTRSSVRWRTSRARRRRRFAPQEATSCETWWRGWDGMKGWSRCALLRRLSDCEASEPDPARGDLQRERYPPR
jgi:REP element-mobilizing transposase RayT